MRGRNFVGIAAAAVLLAALALGLGCSATNQSRVLNRETAWVPKKLAVLPYQKVPHDPTTGNAVSCPLTGSAFTSGQIIPGAESTLNQALNAQLGKVSKVPFVPYTQAGLVLSRVSGRDLEDTLRQEIAATGKALGADAVLVGFVYRFRQRVGDAYGVDTPASVAFDLLVVRARDGSVIWKNSFDETQKSLSQDLLNLGQYMKHGLRWYTAEELGQIGMSRLMKSFPWRKATAKAE